MWIRLGSGLWPDSVFGQMPLPKCGATEDPCWSGSARGRLIDFLNLLLQRGIEGIRSMRNYQMNSESHSALNVPKCLVQFAVLRLVPALDLMIELMMVEAILEPFEQGIITARSVNDYINFVNVLMQN